MTAVHQVDCISFICACDYCVAGMFLGSNLGWSYFRERAWLIGCCSADIITSSEEWQACQDLSVTHTQSTVCNVPVYSTQSANTGLILYGTMREHMEEATKALCVHLYNELLVIQTFLHAEQLLKPAVFDWLTWTSVGGAKNGISEGLKDKAEIIFSFLIVNKSYHTNTSRVFSHHFPLLLYFPICGTQYPDHFISHCRPFKKWVTNM